MNTVKTRKRKIWQRVCAGPQSWSKQPLNQLNDLQLQTTCVHTLSQNFGCICNRCVGGNIHGPMAITCDENMTSFIVDLRRNYELAIFVTIIVNLLFTFKNSQLCAVLAFSLYQPQHHQTWWIVRPSTYLEGIVRQLSDGNCNNHCVFYL